MSQWESYDKLKRGLYLGYLILILTICMMLFIILKYFKPNI